MTGRHSESGTRGTLVEADGLTLAYGDRTAISDASFQLRGGSVVALIGPNGSGKSSLLDCLAGLMSPRSGTVRVLGEAPGNGKVAYVFQYTETPAHLPLTVTEVVTMGRYLQTGLLGRLGAAGRRSVRAAMEAVGIEDLAKRQLFELSGGQRQRVMIAQGLANTAELLVLDEPMTGLDVVSREQILAVLRHEQSNGRSVIYSTHDMAEARLADEVILVAGRIVAIGEPDDVLIDEHLRAAYMGRLVEVAGAPTGFVDDPHHH